MKKYRLRLVVSLLLAGCFLAAGCSPKWREKFIRKKKKAAPTQQAILVLQPDYKALLPVADRYREHFAFYKSWSSSLIDSYGDLRKRDKVNLQGVIGETEAMQGLLTGLPSVRLKEILRQLQQIEDQWERMPDTWTPPHSTRLKIERLTREVNRDFHYSEVKDSLIGDPDQP